jgi:predicted nucleotidyltransferase
MKTRTAAQVTEDDMAIYRATARRRWAQEQQEMRQRRERAWALARQASSLLREQFNASRVMVFGSLVRSGLFHLRSDVDLAVWGLDERVYYRAVSQLLSLDPSIEVDLVIAEEAPVTLRTVIEEEGVLV